MHNNHETTSERELKGLSQIPSGKIGCSSCTDPKKAVLIVAAFAAFLTPFLGSSVNLALPSIGKDLGASAIEMGWVISSFILSSAISLIPFGKLADIVGRKRVFSAGLLLFTLSTIIIVFSRSFAFLIVMRICQGISSAMIFGTSLAIITSVFEPGQRGRAMGINVTAVYLGLSAGPIIGGFLTQYLGWRSIFAFLVPFGIASLVLIKLKIKDEWADSRTERFDTAGSMFYAISLFSLIYGFSTLPSVTSWILILSGIVLGTLFFMYEKRIDNPVFDIRLMLQNKVFAFSGIAALIHYSATSATGFFISLYLQYLKGFDARTAGFIMISQPVMMALLSPLAGRLSDRRNPGVIASYGMGLTAAGLVMLCFVNERSHLIMIVSLLVIMGVGFGLFSSPNANAIMSSVEKSHYGVASGVVGTMRMTGQMLSMGIAMMLISVYLGKEQIDPANYSRLLAGMRTGFGIFSVLSVLGIFASLARNNGIPSKLQD
ncbi:MAG: MFS transporter [Verrucomicrobia bacterium]|jgi:EmrB/QacA subfamily drug resistance transporter|nr:MFS transporter [Verrucomicrobiota bacterium]MDI9380167.1 MFS transporter [Verrucomicrobiota bacterium]HOA60032.1 MFS transporter [Verrucomicrobiota bacterium]HOF47594.1 MFS transporter [Verrucomicrobiota bacterium]HOR70616.1 MFS transporter [Verrucomicrobiota bacterium]